MGTASTKLGAKAGLPALEEDLTTGGMPTTFPEKRLLRMGDVYRYARPHDPYPPLVDGFPNYFYHTHRLGDTLPLHNAGINTLRIVDAPDRRRRPAILISSSPHRIGTELTPWQDFFDTDNGHIRYFGDNKLPGVDPASMRGNKALLAAFRAHSALDVEGRSLATPLLFFRRVPRLGRMKGFVQFEGFGITAAVELVTQYDHRNGRTFTNYAFDFVVMSLAAEHELFNWNWINARRDLACTLAETLALAPAAWKTWVHHGKPALNRYRRHVAKLLVVKTAAQRPLPGSRAEAALREIYDFYCERGRERFEALASHVAARVVGGADERYRLGWITPPSSDWGMDFIGRLDVGTGFSTAKLVVLGQAKCEEPSRPTSGTHIARTVARLKRGWIGVYVTTSYFSDRVQREVLEDAYPLVMVHGLRVAEEVLIMVQEGGYPSIATFLAAVDSDYDSLIRNRRPEEILLD